MPLEIRTNGAQGSVIGGITFVIEIAVGHLEGKLFLNERVAPRRGTVRVENVKQPELVCTTAVTSRGNFSFQSTAPGSCRLQADCGAAAGTASLFVYPNRITSKDVLVERKVVIVPIPRKELVAKAA